MPIVGLTDNIVPRFPLIGRLRKGSPQISGEAGDDLNHFRFSPVRGHEYLTPIFTEAYGRNPKEIRAWLAFETLEECFPTWMDEYSTHGSLLRRCDGDTLYRWRSKDGFLKNEHKPCERSQGCNCMNRGYLNLILPGFLRNNCIGMVQMQTGYYLDILTLSGNIKATTQYVASLKGIEFTLKREPKTVTVNEKGKACSKEKYICSLTPVAAECQNWFKPPPLLLSAANPLPPPLNPPPEKHIQTLLSATRIQFSVVKAIAKRIANTDNLSQLSNEQLFRLQLEVLAKFAVNSKKFLSVPSAILDLQHLLNQLEAPSQPLTDDLLQQCLSYLSTMPNEFNGTFPRTEPTNY